MMKRKRIEIISSVLVVAMGCFDAFNAPAHAGGALQRAEPLAIAFPVYLEPERYPVPLDPVPGLIPEGDAAPDIPYSYFWTAQDGLELRASDYVLSQEISEHSPGLLGGFDQPYVTTPGTRWLPIPTTQSWSLGTKNWQAQLDPGLELALGSSEVGVPEWNDSLRLSGVSLSQSFLASSADASQWNYSVAFGAVDHSSGTTSGDLVFGPMAGSVSMSYQYSPQLSVTTHTEMASDLFMSDFTSEYDLGTLGRWRTGIARSNHPMQQGWRYRAMADFDLSPDLNMGWQGERYTEGFMDIRRYSAGSGAAEGGRHRWSASWDTDDWGTWSGSFESEHGKDGVLARRFGLNQQFWYSPNLRIGVHAEKEVIGGDYDIGLRFSFPLF